MIEASFPNLRQLRAVSAVVRNHSISRASAEIGLSQPAITTSIATLEKELGVLLFDRAARGSFPTAAGNILARRVQRLHDATGDVISQATGKLRAHKDVTSISNRLTSTQCRILMTASDIGLVNVSGALGISEYSVLRNLREMERSIGQKLHLRYREGTEMTAVGKLLAAGLKLAFTEYRFGLDEISNARGIEGQRLLIGSLSLAKNHLLPSAIEKLVAHSKNVRVEVIQGTYDSLVNELRNGSIDLLVGAVRGAAAHEDLAEEILFTERYCLVVGPAHPLLDVPTITMQHLQAYEWVVPRQNSPIRDYFDDLFAKDGLPPRCHVETSDFATVRALLQNGFRISIMSPSQIKIDRRVGLLSPLVFDDLTASRAIGVTVRRDWLPTEAHAALIQILRETQPA